MERKTAEEILFDLNELDNPSETTIDYLMSKPCMTGEMSIKAMHEYAAQETAALQKQNAELREVLRLITERCDAEILPSDKLITKAYKLLKNNP